jgi:hypothetical protein
MMKATYREANGALNANWLVAFDTIEDTDYFVGFCWTAAQDGVEVVRIGNASLMLVMPDDNPNPFTTGVLRPGAAVVAAELGAVLVAKDVDGDGYDAFFCWHPTLDCIHNADANGKPIIGPCASLMDMRIHSFPPFTEPLCDSSNT